MCARKMETNNFRSSYRWVMLIIELVMVFFFSLMLLMPSPLITTISEQTGWDMGQAGSLNGIVFLLMGAFALPGSFILDKLGTKKSAIVALAIGGAGSVLSAFVGDNYALQYLGRFLFGVGFGLFFVVPGTVISYWFDPKSAPMWQGLRASCDLLGCGVAYYVVLPVRDLMGTWQLTFAAFGVVLFCIMIVYLIFGRVSESEKLYISELKAKKADKTASKAANVDTRPGLVQALTNKYCVLIAVAMIGKIWTYSTFTTYLPAYLELERGMTAEIASSYTGVISIVGMIAGVTCGALATAIGRRKILTWPMIAIVAVGALLSLYTDGVMLAISCALLGFGTTGYMTCYVSIPAELPGSNASMYAGSVGLTLGAAYIISFFCPNAFQAMLDSGMTMQTALLISAIPDAICIIPALFIMETGPKGKYQKKLALEKAAD